MSMAIEGSCECGKRLRAPDGSAGRRAKCPGCGRVLQVPAGPATPAVGAVGPPQQAALPPVPTPRPAPARKPAPPPPRARPAPAPAAAAEEDSSDEYGLAD